jgi:hypothetical protein
MRNPIGRPTYLVISWTLLAAVVVQFFLAGVGVFAGPSNFQLHRAFASVILALILLGIGACFLAGVSWRTTGKWGLLTVLLIFQGVLVALSSISPYLPALHPVNGLAIAFLTIHLAVSARRAAAPSARPAGAEYSAVA